MSKKVKIFEEEKMEDGRADINAYARRMVKSSMDPYMVKYIER